MYLSTKDMFFYYLRACKKWMIIIRWCHMTSQKVISTGLGNGLSPEQLPKLVLAHCQWDTCKQTSVNVWNKVRRSAFQPFFPTPMCSRQVRRYAVCNSSSSKFQQKYCVSWRRPYMEPMSTLLSLCENLRLRRLPMDSSYKGASNAKPSIYRWFETLWLSYNVMVMNCHAQTVTHSRMSN